MSVLKYCKPHDCEQTMNRVYKNLLYCRSFQDELKQAKIVEITVVEPLVWHLIPFIIKYIIPSVKVYCFIHTRFISKATV